MKRTLPATAAALALTLFASLTEARAAEEPRRPVDLVICLDTSGSMDGLIESAKRKLWDITNELASAKPTPKLRVALLVYGSPTYGADGGWVKTESPFTEDLDELYKRLFALRTNGGEEYVGRVVKTALEQLSWSDAKDALKVVFVCGNESADQDRAASFRDQCKAALAKGVNVNAIYCGNAGDHDAAGWRELATLGEGRFATIDHNRAVVEIPTPYDKKLAELSGKLNGTYIAVGAAGERGRANQAEQDSNAGSLGGSASAARAQAKAGSNYRCDWDLVDKCKDRSIDLEKAKDEELPAEMKGMSIEERKAFVAKKTAEREAVQKEIAELAKKRDEFIAAELKKSGEKNESSLDAAVKEAIRTQAEKKGFTFEKK